MSNTSVVKRARQAGASLIEYLLLVSLIALVCLSALTYFGHTSGNSLTNSCSKILAAGGNSAASGC